MSGLPVPGSISLGQTPLPRKLRRYKMPALQVHRSAGALAYPLLRACVCTGELFGWGEWTR